MMRFVALFAASTLPLAAEVMNIPAMPLGESTRPAGDASLMRTCLPMRYASAGYQATLIHGFDAHMFDRQSWSPQLGFQRLLFRHELLQAGVKSCDGPFAGACDQDVARWIGDQLVKKRDHPQFIYWLTLNSHLPIQKMDDETNPLRCESEEAVASDPATCDLLTLVANVQRAIAETAQRPDLPETEFLLVGDHAPPFLYKFRREQFSQTEVPFVHLVPKPQAIVMSR